MLKILAKCTVCNELLKTTLHNTESAPAEQMAVNNPYDTIAYISVEPCNNCNNKAWNGGYYAGKKAEKEP